MEKKEKLLKKYLDKKKNQLKRDDILAQIADLTKTKPTTINLANFKPKSKKKKRTKKNDDSFEKMLFKDDDLPSNDSKVSSESEERVSHNYKNCSKKISQKFDSEIKIENEKSEDIAAVTINEPLRVVENEMIEQNVQNIMIDDHNPLLKEHFVRYELIKRTDEIQEQRKRLQIIYEEDEIISKIKRNLITFIQGNTGCGKTTQIPQFLLENGFASKGKIGITQPRRLSAISVASRINTELNQNLCGYKIKYENTMKEDMKIKVMTDGVLVQEIMRDFLLLEYSVIILDEVHERSTNIDLLIGLLSKIVSIRSKKDNPLRLILMSATVETEDFKKVLPDFATVKINFKAFKVDAYFEDQTSNDYISTIFNKIITIIQLEGQLNKRKKNINSKMLEIPFEIVNDETASILVFLPSKEDIYYLKKLLEDSGRDLTVLPLHSGLNKTEQSLVYKKYDSRKIVLATNIAETSITIDDIVFVIDSGRAKYKIKDNNCVKFKIDFISKSSANQRMGRAGRVKPGLCFRCYSAATFEQFEDNNIPQILMEPLDSIIVQLKALGIKNTMKFPFITSPPESLVKDSIFSLQNLGILSSEGNLTPLGKSISEYPLEPKIARILCLKDIDDIFYEMAVIASILSSDFEVKKNEQTRAFFDNSKSDLITYLKIYLFYEKSGRNLLTTKKLGLNQNALEEIGKLSQYLIKISARTNIKLSYELTDAKLDKICKMLFYAFCDNVAIKNENGYSFIGGEIFISKDSVDSGNENIVLEHVVCGTNKCFAKNITVINPSWF